MRAHACDAMIVGGGPAADAVALELLRAGARCCVLERSRFDAPRLGETVPPRLRPTLEALGLWQSFRGSGHVPSLGIRSAWGGPELQHQDFLFDPYGRGWHLDRNAFDRAGLDAVRQAGGLVVTASRLDELTDRCDGWQATVMHGAERLRLSAAFVVDATGQAAGLARRLGIGQVVVDSLVGCAGFFAPCEPHRELDPWLLLEAVAEGWWYSVPLPGARALAVLMTDADLLPGTDERGAEAWRRGLAETQHTRARLAAETGPERLVTRPARSRRLTAAANGRFIAVGDAASSFDPLAAQGIDKALRTGRLAAQAILAALGGDEGAFGNYAATIAAEFDDYLRQRRAYYATETRWPDAPFWRRRHAASA